MKNKIELLDPGDVFNCIHIIKRRGIKELREHSQGIIFKKLPRISTFKYELNVSFSLFS